MTSIDMASELVHRDTQVHYDSRHARRDSREFRDLIGDPHKLEERYQAAQQHHSIEEHDVVSSEVRNNLGADIPAQGRLAVNELLNQELEAAKQTANLVDHLGQDITGNHADELGAFVKAGAALNKLVVTGDSTEQLTTLKWYATGNLSYLGAQKTDLVGTSGEPSFANNTGLSGVNEGSRYILGREVHGAERIAGHTNVGLASHLQSQRSAAEIKPNSQRSLVQFASLSLPEYLKKKITIIEGDSISVVVRDYSLSTAEKTLIKNALLSYFNESGTPMKSLVMNGKEYV